MPCPVSPLTGEEGLPNQNLTVTLNAFLFLTSPISPVIESLAILSVKYC